MQHTEYMQYAQRTLRLQLHINSWMSHLRYHEGNDSFANAFWVKGISLESYQNITKTQIYNYLTLPPNIKSSSDISPCTFFGKL